MIVYFFKRALAYIIDCSIAFSVVMLVFQWAILSQIRDNFGVTEEWFKDSINLQLYVLLSISIPVWLYFAYFDSKNSRGTLGKRLFKLSVQTKNGQKISFRKSLLRTILKLLPWEIVHAGIIFPTPIYYEIEPDVRWLSYFGILLFIVYIVSIFINLKRQTLYDQVLNTVVYSKYIKSNT